MSVDSFKPPINDWPNLLDFKQFLTDLQNLGLPNLLTQYTPLSSVSGRLLLYSPQGDVQSAFVNWFFHHYNTQSRYFSHTIWTVLQENSSHCSAVISRIQRSPFRWMFESKIFPKREQWHLHWRNCSQEYVKLLGMYEQEIRSWQNLAASSTGFPRTETINDEPLSHWFDTLLGSPEKLGEFVNLIYSHLDTAGFRSIHSFEQDLRFDFFFDTAQEQRPLSLHLWQR